MPGEQAWPTQPFPTAPPPFARQKFGPDDINPYLDPEEKKRIHDIVVNASNQGIFTPPAYNRDQIAVPGEMGGANWGSTAADPAAGMLYVRAYDAPAIHHMTESPPVQQMPGSSPERAGYQLYMQHCVGCHGPNRERITYPREIGMAGLMKVLRNGKDEMPAFSEGTLTPANVDSLAAYLSDPLAATADAPGKPGAGPQAPPAGQKRFYGVFGNIFRASNGLIAFSPPWSSLVAYDLNTGTIKWRRPIGTTPGLAAKGIIDTGSSEFIRNGPVVTAGGLIFIGTGPDRMVHALDRDSGETLWETELDANPDGIPAVYEVGGRECVAFFAASSGARETVAYKPGKPDAQGYYVFALPKQ